MTKLRATIVVEYEIEPEYYVDHDAAVYKHPTPEYMAETDHLLFELHHESLMEFLSTNLYKVTVTPIEGENK